MRWRVALLAMAAAASLVPLPPSLVERLYSTGAYPALQVRLTAASNQMGFAFLDLLGAVFSALQDRCQRFAQSWEARIFSN